MFSVHVLLSRTTGRFYTRATSDLPTCLEQHNSHHSISAKHCGPWDLVHDEEFPTLAAAIHRGRYFKSGKGREELKRILQARPRP